MTDAPDKNMKPLRSAAMIASIADPGMRTTKAPFGEALVKAASGPEAKAAAAKHKASVEFSHRDNAFKVATALEEAPGMWR